MECNSYAINASATQPEEVMFGTSNEAPGNVFRNITEYGGYATSAPGESRRPSTTLFDMVRAPGLQASQKLPAPMNYESSNSATSRKSSPVDECVENLGYSKSSWLGTLLPLPHRDVKTSPVSSSNVADDQAIAHVQQEGKEAAPLTELEMNETLRQFFGQEGRSQSESTCIPIQCGMSCQSSPSGLLAWLSEPMAASEFISVPPNFSRPVEVAQGGISPRRRRSQRTTGDSSGESHGQRPGYMSKEQLRRKEMNKNLAALKSRIPARFLEKTTNASIVGGAVEFIKELEKLLNYLESMQRRRAYNPAEQVLGIAPPHNFPTSSISSCATATSQGVSNSVREQARGFELQHLATVRRAGIPRARPSEVRAECSSSVATVEVKVSGRDAEINIITRWRAKQLVKVIGAIEGLDLSIERANIIPSKSTVLYTFNAKVGTQCNETTVNQVAASLHKTFNSFSFAVPP